MSANANLTELSEDSKQLQEAAIEERLRMTYEQRIQAHENALQLANDLKIAGEIQRAKSQISS